jgi:hypothetical protein
MTGLAHRLRSLNRGLGCCVAGRAVLVVGTLGLGAGNWSCSMQLRSGSRGLWVTLQKLPGRAPGDAHSNAQSAANHARSHSVYDGSSGPRAPCAMVAVPGLLSKGIGSKVERFHAATCIESGVGRRSWRYP